MDNEHSADWDPKSDRARENQEAVYDQLRRTCPVAHNASLGWSVFKNKDVWRILLDHEGFSNAVSQHLSVPNGIDPPEHTAFRKIIEPYFAAEQMNAFEPRCRAIARQLALGLRSAEQPVEIMRTVALPFAVSVQCSFLGWPEELKPRLIDWVLSNQQATHDQDRKALSAIAREFEAIIDDLLDQRRKTACGPERDLTAALMHEKVNGRPLSNEEVASILRNWTAGEIGTISAAVGILIEFLAAHQDLQKQLRGDFNLLSYAIDEILRIHGPLVTNRRVVTRPTEVGGNKLAAGDRVTLNWLSANRDEAVFETPELFRWDRDQAKNLLYGAGIHVCPGAPLARLELKVFLEELFGSTAGFQLSGTHRPTKAVYPASGFAALFLVVSTPETPDTSLLTRAAERL